MGHRFHFLLHRGSTIEKAALDDVSASPLFRIDERYPRDLSRFFRIQSVRRAGNHVFTIRTPHGALRINFVGQDSFEANTKRGAGLLFVSGPALSFGHEFSPEVRFEERVVAIERRDARSARNANRSPGRNPAFWSVIFLLRLAENCESTSALNCQ